MICFCKQAIWQRRCKFLQIHDPTLWLLSQSRLRSPWTELRSLLWAFVPRVRQTRGHHYQSPLCWPPKFSLFFGLNLEKQAKSYIFQHFREQTPKNPVIFGGQLYYEQTRDVFNVWTTPPPVYIIAGVSALPIREAMPKGRPTGRRCLCSATVMWQKIICLNTYFCTWPVTIYKSPINRWYKCGVMWT